MVEGYEQAEGLELNEVEKQEIVIELEDTFQEITEVQEKEFIASLPEKTRDSYQQIVDDSADTALVKTLWVINIFTVIAAVLALFLPGLKLSE